MGSRSAWAVTVTRSTHASAHKHRGMTIRPSIVDQNDGARHQDIRAFSSASVRLRPPLPARQTHAIQSAECSAGGNDRCLEIGEFSRILRRLLVPDRVRLFEMRLCLARTAVEAQQIAEKDESAGELRAVRGGHGAERVDTPTRCSDRSRAERRIRSRCFSPPAVPSSFIRSPHNSLRCRSAVHCRRN